MAIHLADSIIYGGDYADPEMRAIWDETGTIREWLHFEATLAEVQAELGMIPEYAAKEIRAKATLDHVKIERIAEIYRENMIASVSMIKTLKEACEGDAGEYIHYGATTQDIFDNTLAVRLGKTLNILEAKLVAIRDILNTLALKHKRTLMAAYTHGQHALPVSFGYIAAIWSAMVETHIARLREARPRICSGTLCGAVGTFASFQAIADAETCLKMQRMVLERLGINVAPINMQPRMDWVCEFMSLLGLMSVPFEKMADEIFLSQRPELDQLQEPFDSTRQIGSSTMPQKRNPVRCEMTKGLAKKLRSNAAAMAETHMRDLRDYTGFVVQDLSIPESAILADTMLNLMRFTLGELVVNPDRMLKHLKEDGPIMSEALMLALSKKTGKKQTAHAIVYKAAMGSFDTKTPFVDYCLGMPEIAGILSREELLSVLQPENYIGLNDMLIDAVVGQSAR